MSKSEIILIKSIVLVSVFDSDVNFCTSNFAVDWSFIVSVPSATLLVDEEHPVSVNGELVNRARINNRDETANSHVSKPKEKVRINIPILVQIWGGLSSTGLQKAVEKEHDMTDQDKVEMNIGAASLQTSRAVVTSTDELLRYAPPIAQQSVSTESKFDVGIPPGYISDCSIDQCVLDNAADLIRGFGSRLEHDLPLDEVVKRVQKVSKMLVFSGVPLTGWVDGSQSLLRAWKLRNQVQERSIEHDKLIEATEASMVLQSQHVDDLRAQHVSIDGELSAKILSLSSLKEESALIQSKINQTMAELGELWKKFAHVTHELDVEAKPCILLERRRRDVEDQLSIAESEVCNRKKKLEEMKSDRKRRVAGLDVDEDTANVAVEQAIKNITSLSYGVAGHEGTAAKLLPVQADLEKVVIKEYAMTLQDKRTEEAKEARKALEAFVLTMRKELNGKYQDFVGELEKESLAHKLQWLEDWLYDEGDEEDKDAYVAQLKEHTKLRKPIEVRYKEDVERESAISVLVNMVNDYVGIICSGDPQWDHINPTEKETMLNACNAAQRWLGMKRQEQDRLPKNVDPVLLCADLVDGANHLDRVCRTIISKPRPQQISQPSSIPTEAATFSRSPQKTLYRDDTIDVQKGGKTYNPRTQADPKKVKEARKALKAFVLTTKKELNGKYRDFVAPLEEESVITNLKEIEHWLYNEGKDQDKAVYLSKLGELTRLSNPIKARYKEDQLRETSISFLEQWIKYYQEITCSADQHWDHIDPTERQKVVDVCNLVEQWLNDRKLKQEHLPKHADPVLICDNLRNAAEFIISFCKPIMFKPKP